MIKAVNFRYRSADDLNQASDIIDLSSPQNNLIQIFTDNPDKNTLNQLINELTSRFPKVPVSGINTATEIAGGQAGSGDIIVNITAFESAGISSYLLPGQHTFQEIDGNIDSLFSKLQNLHKLIDASDQDIDSLIEQMADKTNKDALTMLGNRRYFDEQLNEELEVLNNFGPNLSVMLIDIDFFKQYNDHYGHSAGDNCLTMIGEVLTEVAEQNACTAARYGGEEFVMLLPNTAQISTLMICKQVNEKVEALNIEHKHSTISDHLTVSIGYLTLNQPTDLSTRDILHHCDEYLDTAKQQGKNRAAGGVLEF